MDTQTQIENVVTNGRGYDKRGSGFGKSETDSYTALQARLAYMEGKQYGEGEANELTQLDKDLKHLGFSDSVNTLEAVEQALKIKRYFVSLATDAVRQIQLAHQREQDSANIIPKKNKISGGYISNLDEIKEIKNYSNPEFKVKPFHPGLIFERDTPRPSFNSLEEILSKNH